MDNKEEQALKQFVLRYNTKTTHCIVDKKRFRVVGYRSLLEARRREVGGPLEIDVSIQTDEGFTFIEGVVPVGEFETWVQAFHSFSGVTQQLMNADGSELFEVGMFDRWISDWHPAKSGGGE